MFIWVRGTATYANFHSPSSAVSDATVFACIHKWELVGCELKSIERIAELNKCLPILRFFSMQALSPESIFEEFLHSVSRPLVMWLSLLSGFYFQSRVCNLNTRNWFQIPKQANQESYIMKLTFRSIAEGFLTSSSIPPKQFLVVHFGLLVVRFDLSMHWSAKRKQLDPVVHCYVIAVRLS